MTQYHAVMVDETGCEFGYTFNAADRHAAWDYLDEQFPESRCVQLEDPTDMVIVIRRSMTGCGARRS